MENAIITNGNVDGTVSNCTLSDEIIGTDRKSVFNLQSKQTYAAVSSCTGETVSTYTVPELTGFGITVVILASIVIIIAVASAIATWVNNY